MSKKIVYTSKAPEPIGPYSQAVIANNFMFISGQIPIDPEKNELVEGSIEKQTTVVMQNLTNIIKSAQLGVENIVKITIFLKDINDFQAVNGVYQQFFDDNPPARAVVQAANLPKGVPVEIEAVAYIPIK